MTRLPYLAAVALAALPAAALAQQTAPPPLVPGLDNFSLPSSHPIPRATDVPSDLPTVAPLPRATPTTRPTPTPRATSTPRATPTPRAPATPRAAPSPRPTPSAAPTPQATLTPTPTPTPAPKPTPTAAAVLTPVATPVPTASPAAPTPVPSSGGPGLWIAGALAALALIALGWWLGRRGRTRPVALAAPAPRPTAKPVPASEPAPAAPASRPLAPAPAAPAFLDRGAPPAPPAPRPRIELTLFPRRGGLNMISATIEGELLVRNTGDRAAEAVRVDAALLAARSGQEAELGDYLSQPVLRSAAAPFTLAPGEERRVRVVSALPLAQVEPVMAGGRPMLVPLVAARASYSWGAIDGQTGITLAVGVERPGQARLAPFWMDAPRMHDALAARPHALAVAR